MEEGPRVAEVLQQMVDEAEDNDAQGLIGLQFHLAELQEAFQANP